MPAWFMALTIGAVDQDVDRNGAWFESCWVTAEKMPYLQDFFVVELAGLEPATSWVRFGR
jgi:hypothetical protein